MKKIVLLILSFAMILKAEMSALEIMQKVEDRPTGDKIISEMTLTLTDKFNKQRIRKLKRYFIEKGQSDWSLMFFISPADVKNTSFLTYDYKNEDKSDDQWMYTPADKKIRRIASNDKSASFMGTDMNYSDMVSPTLSDYNFKILKTDEINGHKTWVIQSTPKSEETIKETGYKKGIAWIRQDNFCIVRSMKYVAKSSKIKYMTVKKLEQIDGIWVNKITEMKTMKGKEFLHKTTMTLSNISFNNNIAESMFSQPRMRQGL